jgi:protein CpxP
MTMKKIIRLFVVIAGIGSAAALGGQIAQANQGKEYSHEMAEGFHHCGGYHHGRHHRFEKMAATLGLSEQQKAKIKDIFKQNRQQAEAVHAKLFTEKRNMRTLVQADKTDEAAIRAEATKIAGIEGDLAVQRAHMIHQMRAVLTPEQQAKFKTMQQERQSKFEKFHHHAGEATDKTGTKQ